MKKIVVMCLFLVAGICGQDVTLSKDSLWVYNNPVMSRTDGLFIRNNGTDTVWVDSAALLFEVFDTTGLSSAMEHQAIETIWTEFYADNNHMAYTWSMNRIDWKNFSLRNQNNTLDVRKPCTTAPGDSTLLDRLQIGFNFFVSSLPIYPQYLRGTLRLFFSSGEVVDIRLYSEDLRPVVADQSCSDYACDSMNVRKILDRNGMESVPVSKVSSVGSGRITTLSFSYHPEAASSLPKPIKILPQEIGNLTALRTIGASGNSIDSISPQIGRCSNLTNFLADNNGISELPDSVVLCSRLISISLDNNQLTRLPDSIGKLKSLRQLSVAENLLTSLPESMADLDSIDCVFVAGNRICTLPEAVITLMSNVRAQSKCARFDPVWPDSQDCSVALAGQANTRDMPAATILRVSNEGGMLTVETGISNCSADAVELSNVAGRLARRATVLPGRTGVKIRLSTRGLARGVYYIALVSHGKIIGGHPILINRQVLN